LHLTRPDQGFIFSGFLLELRGLFEAVAGQ